MLDLIVYYIQMPKLLYRKYINDILTYICKVFVFIFIIQDTHGMSLNKMGFRR